MRHNMNTNLNETRSKLPRQADIETFLRTVHFPKDPQQSYHLSELVAVTADHFKLAPEVVTLKLADFGFNGHGNTGTFLECLVIWGTFQLTEEGHVKKVGPNQWSDIHCTIEAYSLPPLSKREVGFAQVSVKILKGIEWDAEKIKLELSGKWSPPVLAMAIRNVFGVSA